MMLMAKLPGIAKRTGHVIVAQDVLQPEDFVALVDNVRVVRAGIITWRRSFNIALLQIEQRPPGETADFGKRYELLGLSLIINIMASRMLCCIVPNERAFLEEEIQYLAVEFQAVKRSAEHNHRASFFLAQKAKIANAAITTHADFQCIAGSGRIVDLCRWQRFCKAIGRRCCDENMCCG